MENSYLTYDDLTIISRNPSLPVTIYTNNRRQKYFNRINYSQTDRHKIISNIVVDAVANAVSGRVTLWRDANELNGKLTTSGYTAYDKTLSTTPFVFNYLAYAYRYVEVVAYSAYGGTTQLTTFNYTINYTHQATPSITLSSKDGEFIDNKKEYNVSIISEQVEPIFEQFSITSAVLHYKVKGTSTYTNVNFANGTVKINANTLSNNTDYEMYASWTVDDGQTGNTSVITVTTKDAIPVCTAVSPSNSVAYKSVPFVWNYETATGSQQTAYDIQVSYDGVSWNTIANHVMSSLTRATINVEQSGTVYWRVRGYNTDNITGEWSNVLSFINVAPAVVPSITSITGNGRKTVKWISTDQIAYQLQLLDGDSVIYDSGEIYSTDKEYMINEYPNSNTYTVRVRIVNGYGMTSEWASNNITYNTYATGVSASLVNHGDSVGIVINDVPAYVKYYIVRNGVLIAKTTHGTYEDYTADGASEYKVIGVTSDDYYNYINLNTTFKHSHTLIVNGGEVVRCNLNWGSRITPNYSITPDYAQHNYFGASVPAFAFSKLKTKTYNVTIFDKDNRYDDLIGNVIYFATTYGYGDWCVITSLNRTDHIYGNTVSLNLSVTSYEGIEYDL